MSEFEPKTYALLSNGKNLSPYYRETQQGKVYILKNETFMIPLRTTVIDPATGRRIVLRYLPDCNTIIQEEQIEQKYLANMPFPKKAYEDMRFVDGFKKTETAIQQLYLESVGYFVGCKYKRPNDVTPLFEEFAPMLAINKNNVLTRAQARAIRIFDELGEGDQKKLLLKIFGSHYVISEDPEMRFQDITNMVNKSTAQNMEIIDLIVDYAPDSRKDEDDVTILVGLCINEGLLDFKKNPSKILAKTKGKKAFIEIFDVAETLDLESKIALFSDYLHTKAGEATFQTLKGSLTVEPIK